MYVHPYDHLLVLKGTIFKRFSFLLFKVFNLPTAILYLPAQWAVFTTCYCGNDCSIYEEACWGGGTCNGFQRTQDIWSFSVTWSYARSCYYRGSLLVHSSGLASVVNCFPGCVCWSYLACLAFFRDVKF